MSTKVGINGFGRIGRNAFKAAIEKGAGFDVVAINDVTSPKTLAHLLKYDSIFGPFKGTVEAKDDAIIVNGKEIRITAVRNPADLPWKELGVEVVLESTGLFTKKPDAEKHLRAGAKKVIISAPATDEDITVVMGVNEEKYDPREHHILSNASCTTNCIAPIAKVIDRNWGIVEGLMTTIHSYTNDQKILDQPHKDLRRARAAATSIIPTTTGAAKAVSLVLPKLHGRLSGMALRVPTPAVSVVDAVFRLDMEADRDQINKGLRDASEAELKGILGYSEEPLVSVDYRGDPRSAIVDGLSTLFVDSKFVKIIAWYDNEWGYSNRSVDLIEYVIAKGL